MHRVSEQSKNPAKNPANPSKNRLTSIIVRCLKSFVRYPTDKNIYHKQFSHENINDEFSKLRFAMYVHKNMYAQIIIILTYTSTIIAFFLMLSSTIMPISFISFGCSTVSLGAAVHS